MTKGKFPGWRTMTASQRHNAKADEIWEHYKAHHRKTHPVAVVLDVGVIHVVERFATVKEAEDFLATSRHVDPEHLKAGHYGIDAPEEMVNPQRKRNRT